MEQFKRAKVIMLPTESFIPGSLIQHSDNKKLQLITNSNFDEEDAKHLITTKWNTAFNIYIISDDKIKEGDYFINDDVILKCTGFNQHYILSEDKYGLTYSPADSNKIMATTDTSLGYWKEIMTKAGGDEDTFFSLPQPSQQFITKYIEEYNKGNIITDVLVEYDITWVANHNNGYHSKSLKINPKDNTINIKLEEKHTYTKEQLIKAMIWAENNGKHYVGTDKEGQLEQFNEYINKL